MTGCREEVTLSDFKGQKKVVLAFFPAAFSQGCTAVAAHAGSLGGL